MRFFVSSDFGHMPVRKLGRIAPVYETDRLDPSQICFLAIAQVCSECHGPNETSLSVTLKPAT